MTVLHLLKRNGVALCGAYPRPHHISGLETDCDTCTVLGAEEPRRRTRANRLTPEERSERAKIRWRDRRLAEEAR